MLFARVAHVVVVAVASVPFETVPISAHSIADAIEGRGWKANSAEYGEGKSVDHSFHVCRRPRKQEFDSRQLSYLAENTHRIPQKIEAPDDFVELPQESADVVAL